MTREEISVLSSARREAVRRQLEEIERYKSNPFLYILNPRVIVSTILNWAIGFLKTPIIWLLMYFMATLCSLF